MATLKASIGISDYENLDETVKAFYIEGEEGKTYDLALENDDIKKLKTVADKERDLQKQAKKELAEMRKKIAEYEANKPDVVIDDKEPTDDIRKIVDIQVKAKMSAIERQQQDLLAQLDSYKAQNLELSKKTKQSDLTNAITGILAKTPEIDQSALTFLRDIAVNQLDFDEDRNDFVNESYYSLSDWINAQIEKYPILVKSSVGGGSRTGKNGIVKAVTLQEQVLQKFNKK